MNAPILPEKPIIALLSDFGNRDYYVSSMKGLLLSACKYVNIIDLSHEISHQDVMHGALFLHCLGRDFPEGSIITAVVDPGVGSNRAAIAGYDDHYYFVGPDNGLFSLLASPESKWFKLPIPESSTKTFHGRDIFAPAAAAIASHTELERLGTPIETINKIAIPTVSISHSNIDGEIIYKDAFGNMITNITPNLSENSDTLTIESAEKSSYKARRVSSYHQGESDELIFLKGSWNFIEVAVKNNSAAKLFSLSVGDKVSIRK